MYCNINYSYEKTFVCLVSTVLAIRDHFLVLNLCRFTIQLKSHNYIIWHKAKSVDKQTVDACLTMHMHASKYIVTPIT